MIEKTTYRKSYSKNGLFTLSLVFSLFAFPGIVNTTEACRLEPQHIEVIAFGHDVAESAVFSYQITNSDFFSNTLQSTRVYECNVQLVYQQYVNETLDTISKQSYTYLLPTFFRNTKTESSLRDDSPLLTLG